MANSGTVEIQMPQMGESVTEGTVLEWHKQEGEFVEEGETVVEVSTDKVDAEVPAPADGVITKLLVAVDDEVPVGAPLAEMEPGEGSAAPSAGPVADEDPSSTPPAGDASSTVLRETTPAGLSFRASCMKSRNTGAAYWPAVAELPRDCGLS